MEISLLQATSVARLLLTALYRHRHCCPRLLCKWDSETLYCKGNVHTKLEGSARSFVQRVNCAKEKKMSEKDIHVCNSQPHVCLFYHSIKKIPHLQLKRSSFFAQNCHFVFFKTNRLFLFKSLFMSDLPFFPRYCCDSFRHKFYLQYPSKTVWPQYHAWYFSYFPSSRIDVVEKNNSVHRKKRQDRSLNVLFFISRDRAQ